MKGCIKAEMVTVIKTVTVVGDGTKDNPVRTVIQYWTKEGKLIGQETA